MRRRTKAKRSQFYANQLLLAAATDDHEAAHCRADDILIDALHDAGYHEAADTFQLIRHNFHYA